MMEPPNQSKGDIMNHKLLSGLIVAGTLLLPLAAHADQDSDRSHPGAFVKDSVITTKIKAKLADEKLSTLAHVSVDTDARGMVVLSGHVKSQGMSDRATAIARATEGVVSVTNNIRITPED
jgi:hyperosmotically inducible protein